MKYNKPTPEYDSERETRVLVEELDSRVSLLAEQHGSIINKITDLETTTNQRFDRLEGRFDVLEGRFDVLEGRFDRLEGRFDRIENILTTVMSDHETRIRGLEKKSA